MWLFAKNGFLTFVQHDNRPDLLLVRGRIKGDIENYFPNARVTYRTDRDYAYRTMLPKTRVAERIASAVSAIDYVKYKPSVQDKRRRQTDRNSDRPPSARAVTLTPVSHVRP